MDLRKIAQHPYLVSFPVSPGTTVMPVDERLVSNSGKLQVLDALLKRLQSGGHKVKSVYLNPEHPLVFGVKFILREIERIFSTKYTILSFGKCLSD